MKNTENYVPKKSKSKHPLIVMEEVKKSKEFSALDNELSAFLNETHIKLGSFVLLSSEMNLRAHQERYITSFIRLITVKNWYLRAKTLGQQDCGFCP